MQRPCADVNSPYKWKCWTNSRGPLVNSSLWGLPVLRDAWTPCWWGRTGGSPCTSAGQAARGRAGTPRAPGGGKNGGNFKEFHTKTTLLIKGSVFVPPGSGSGSISTRHGTESGSGSFYNQAKLARKPLIPTSLWLFIFANDVNVASKSDKVILKVTDEKYQDPEPE